MKERIRTEDSASAWPLSFVVPCTKPELSKSLRTASRIGSGAAADSSAIKRAECVSDQAGWMRSAPRAARAECRRRASWMGLAVGERRERPHPLRIEEACHLTSSIRRKLDEQRTQQGGVVGVGGHLGVVVTTMGSRGLVDQDQIS